MLLISVHPKYATSILEGTKTVELRRLRPRMEGLGVVLIYASSPTNALLGAACVTKIQVATPNCLWRSVGKAANVTRVEYDQYFVGAKQAVAIHLSDPAAFSRSVDLSELKGVWPGFHPPQSYRYFSAREVSRLAPIEGVIRSLESVTLRKAA